MWGACPAYAAGDLPAESCGGGLLVRRSPQDEGGSSPPNNVSSPSFNSRLYPPSAHFVYSPREHPHPASATKRIVIAMACPPQAGLPAFGGAAPRDVFVGMLDRFGAGRACPDAAATAEGAIFRFPRLPMIPASPFVAVVVSVAESAPFGPGDQRELLAKICDSMFYYRVFYMKGGHRA